jgi:vacuolar-type H+-ATPase subunit B/Vma2
LVFLNGDALSGRKHRALATAISHRTDSTEAKDHHDVVIAPMPLQTNAASFIPQSYARFAIGRKL